MVPRIRGDDNVIENNKIIPHDQVIKKKIKNYNPNPKKTYENAIYHCQTSH